MSNEFEKEIESRMEKEIEERVTKAASTWIPILVSVLVSFVVTVVVLKFAWAWVVPDLFPGAVSQGLISAELSWWAAVKFAIFAALVSGVYQTLTDAFRSK